jgi:predicted RND superfamily exporter protein
MAMLETPLSIPTQILPSFLLAVGIGATVHLLVVFYQRYDQGDAKEEALAFALGHSGLAIVMTALTTAGGLVSFAVAEIVPVAEMGIFAPIGILLGLAYCMMLLPALLIVSPLARRELADGQSEWGRIQRSLQWLGDRSVRKAWIVVLCTAVVLAFSLAGITRISSTYDPMTWLPEDDPVRRATDLIGSEFGGTTSLEIIVDTGRENGLHDPDLLRRLDALGETFASGEHNAGMSVAKTLSIADMTKEIHQALNANAATHYSIPGSKELVAQELLLFENSGSDDLEDLVDSQFSMGRLTIKLPYAPPLLYEDFIARAVAICEATLGDDVEITATGFVTLITRSLNAVTTSMLWSYAIALAIITPLMFLLLGSIRGGMIAMVPNLTPIVLTLGLMGWLGIPLDLFTLMIGSIAIGLAVDDTIHFMHNFRKYHERSGDVRRAVRETLQTTGHAMLVTSVVLSLSFFMFTLASLQNLVIFGLLTGFTIITAFVSDVTIAPALMALNAGGGRLKLESIRNGLRESWLRRAAAWLGLAMR